ncbi:MAG: hypothetical protein IPG45_16250 [Deltaproteobacteria bacterium]|nr:hypothetical protein [Deltaproteobacteria bacterium]
MLANLTGKLADFGSPWSEGASLKLNLNTDALADATRGWVLHKLECPMEFRRRYGTRSSISADTLLGRFSYTAPEDDDEDEDEESELPSLRLPR